MRERVLESNNMKGVFSESGDCLFKRSVNHITFKHLFHLLSLVSLRPDNLTLIHRLKQLGDLLLLPVKRMAMG